MKLQRTLPVAVAGLTALLCVSCFELVVSLNPWFDVESAVADPRLAGSWCLDDDESTCSVDERMVFAPGPGESWNVFIQGKLRHRVWLAEIDGVRYLDWMFLCEPSRNTEEDDCKEMDFGLGTHLLTQITWQEDDFIEFRLLEEEPFAELLEYRLDPLEYGKTADGLVVMAGSDELHALIAEDGRCHELWTEDTLALTRQRGRP